MSSIAIQLALIGEACEVMHRHRSRRKYPSPIVVAPKPKKLQASQYQPKASHNKTEMAGLRSDVHRERLDLLERFAADTLEWMTKGKDARYRQPELIDRAHELCIHLVD
jgi:hypothetical protein